MIGYNRNRREFVRDIAIVGGVLGLPRLARAVAPATSKRFDLTANSINFNKGSAPFRSIALKNPYSKIQSIGFDPVNEDVYLVQTSGAEYDGQSEAYHASRGDVTITKTNLGGVMSSYMYVNNCGHAISIGVQTMGVNNEPYIWIECDPPAVQPPAVAVGSKIFRFKWTPNTVLNWTSSTPDTYAVLPAGGHQCDCNIDIAYNNLIVRYRNNGAYYAIYDLTQFLSGNTTPWTHFAQPSSVNNLASAFQGYALFGNYLYMINGDSTPSNICPGTEGEGSSYPITLTAMDISSGYTWQSNSNAGFTIGEREPEGMAIYMDTSQSTCSALLCFGFGGYNDDCDSPRTWAASIYCKSSQV